MFGLRVGSSHIAAELVVDVDYGDNGAFRAALTERGLPYIVQIKPSTSVHAAFGFPDYSAGCGRRCRPIAVSSKSPCGPARGC